METIYEEGDENKKQTPQKISMKMIPQSFFLYICFQTTRM